MKSEMSKIAKKIPTASSTLKAPAAAGAAKPKSSLKAPSKSSGLSATAKEWSPSFKPAAVPTPPMMPQQMGYGMSPYGMAGGMAYGGPGMVYPGGRQPQMVYPGQQSAFRILAHFPSFPSFLPSPREHCEAVCSLYIATTSPSSHPTPTPLSAVGGMPMYNPAMMQRGGYGGRPAAAGIPLMSAIASTSIATSAASAGVGANGKKR